MPRTTGRALAAAAGLLLAVAACDDADVGPTGTHDLAEPWQAAPFAVDGARIAGAEQLCRKQMEGAIPAGAPLVIADARGGGRILLVFVAPLASGDCTVATDRNGRLSFEGGGGEGQSEPRAPIEPTAIEVHGPSNQGIGAEAVSYVTGRAGAGIAAVDVVLPSGRTLRASLNQGWFAGWWPGMEAPVTVRGYNAAGGLVGSSP